MALVRYPLNRIWSLFIAVTKNKRTASLFSPSLKVMMLPVLILHRRT